MRNPSFFRFRSWQVGLAILLGCVFVWSSWEDPSLHEYAPPVEFIMLNTPRLQAGAEAERLQARAAALPGVTAAAIRPDKQLLTLAYNPEKLTAEPLCQQLALQPVPVAAPDPTARQYPVPAGYGLALERLRFALNLRRIFVAV
ncbi:hypothetical protein [Hymenobacter elongatus]|uniref:Heavy-metal-associated domain-containing protein n=1 Tax=Hymenobacter elongatus TaxID=877208 RepID=A0A4Z0PLD9_9BACT|nr:hypothetical protein [Hymenobacter elongatus]TGE17011.1 hypothetical protein E5J99_08470 [Hymenobacter elongatus]